ncbi:hypothetical protein Hanom_Chr11g01006951 [Helianthus anomalus]
MEVLANRQLPAMKLPTVEPVMKPPAVDPLDFRSEHRRQSPTMEPVMKTLGRGGVWVCPLVRTFPTIAAGIRRVCLKGGREGVGVCCT